MSDTDPATEPGSTPETPRRPVREERHGETVVDPYRWLEDGDDPEVREWTAAQNAHTDAVLDDALRERLEARFADLADSAEYGSLKPAGGRFFGEVRDPDAEQPAVCVRDSPAGERRVLVDPNEWSESGTVSVDWFAPGPDGDLLAVGVAPGGTEQYDVRVLDVDAGEVIEEVPDTGRGGGRGFAWAPDGFYYTRTGRPESAEVDPDDESGGAADGDAGQLDKEIRYHELGTDPEADAVIADDVGETVWPVLESDGDALVVEFSTGWERSDVYALAGDDRELSPVLRGHDAVFEPTLHDGTVYLVSNCGAPRSRLLAVPLEHALEGRLDPDDLTEVVPEREAVLRDVALDGDRLVAHYHADARSRLRLFDLPGDGPGPAARDGAVDLPEFGTVAAVRAADGRAYYVQESFDRPRNVRAADLRTGESEALLEPDVGFDLDLETSRERFESADGTEVPAFVVRAVGVEPDGTNPGLLTGYGGFRVNRTPTFDRYLEPFLAAGGVFVLATLRGGAEYGEAWHEAGRREHKQRVFDDFLAVAAGLGDRGWVAPDRLGIAGGSNGGLLVGAALTQRPELFAAVLCRVPLLDMLRFHEFLLGGSWTGEYGDPDDPAAFEYLRAYSPYHNVTDRAYPATLFATAAGDTRVHPSHARKAAARFQHRTTGADPILLRVRDDAGHGVGKPRSMVVAEQAENWAFLCRFLGVDPA